MKTYTAFMESAMKTIHTTTINLKTGGPQGYGLRVIFEVKHWKNKVWLNIIAADAGEIPAYASKHYQITSKTKVADVYKWAKDVSKEKMPRSREFDNMFQRLIDFHDPLNEAYTKFDDKTYNEVEFPKDMIRMVKRLTKENDHNNARIIIADVLASVGNRSGAGFKKRYDTLAKLQQKNGEMTQGFLKMRNGLDKSMKTELQRTFSNWKQVWAAL